MARPLAAQGTSCRVNGARDVPSNDQDLLVFSRSVWERERAQDSYLGAKPNPNTLYGKLAWWERIGVLMPEYEDKWWTVNAGMDTEDLSREVLLAIESYGLPAMRAQLRN